ncbi:hypothetical protein V7157_21235 [Neobacillus drentensis]|uniref:hypothetical protein n=1 Tax=Neobacillus drentensis TaxID=220684 RepID=UPI003003909A
MKKQTDIYFKSVCFPFIGQIRVRRSFKKRPVNFIDLIGAEPGRDTELVGRSGSGQGHGRKSLEVYSKLAITDAQQGYNEVINKFPI